MRNLSKEGQEEYKQIVDSLYKDTGINIFDLGLYEETEIEYLDIKPRKSVKKKVKVRING